MLNQDFKRFLLRLVNDKSIIRSVETFVNQQIFCPLTGMPLSTFLFITIILYIRRAAISYRESPCWWWNVKSVHCKSKAIQTYSRSVRGGTLAVPQKLVMCVCTACIHMNWHIDCSSEINNVRVHCMYAHKLLIFSQLTVYETHWVHAYILCRYQTKSYYLLSDSFIRLTMYLNIKHEHR